MECELNPRIPYTELSHIIKKQKEVCVHMCVHSSLGLTVCTWGRARMCGCVPQVCACVSQAWGGPGSWFLLSLPRKLGGEAPGLSGRASDCGPWEGFRWGWSRPLKTLPSLRSSRS